MTALALRTAPTASTPSASCTASSRARCGGRSGRACRRKTRPVRAITNGVHMPTWLSTEMARLFDELPAVRLARPPRRARDVGGRQRDSGRGSLGDARSALRQYLFAFVRERARQRWRDEHVSAARVVAAGTLLDPNALTIGFARRFTGYKRPELIFHDPDRLQAMLNAARRPVQIVFAGKAHPGRRHRQASSAAGLPPRDRSRRSAGASPSSTTTICTSRTSWCRAATCGSTIPRKPLEASGTSGMKASLNGVPHFSIGDGWWAEGYTRRQRLAHRRRRRRRARRAGRRGRRARIYDCSRREIVPTFYELDGGIPRRWLSVVRNAITSASRRASARAAWSRTMWTRCTRPPCAEKPRLKRDDNSTTGRLGVGVSRN